MSARPLERCHPKFIVAPKIFTPKSSRFDRLLDMIDATASSYTSARDGILSQTEHLWGTRVVTQLHRQMLRFDVWAAPWIFTSEMESVAVALALSESRLRYP